MFSSTARFAVIAVAAITLLTSPAQAEEPTLVRGEDFIETPAIGEGYTGGKLDRGPSNQVRTALRELDKQRRIAEAKALLEAHAQ